ncbi:MAG TPA: heme o synthase [Anaerolineae bacterium]
MVSNTRRGFRALTVVASCATLALIVIGGVVRVTGSGLGCPDWPLCYGQVLPPPQIESLIEFAHRFTALLVGVMIVAIAFIALKSHRQDRAVTIPALAGVAVLVVQSLLGAITVWLELPPVIVAVHLGTALAMFACVLTVTANVHHTPGTPARLSSRVFPLALGSAIAVYVLILLGATVTATGASLACPDWPLCRGQLVPQLGDLSVTVHFTHRFAALATAILVTLLVFQARRSRAESPRVWRWALAVFWLFVAQVVVGGMNVLPRLPTVLRALHLGVAASVWGAAVVLVVMLIRDRRALSEASAQKPGRESMTSTPNFGAAAMVAVPARGAAASTTLKKYLYLSKPWIIVLLLITTLTAMLIAGKGSASLALIGATLLGGALASAGANAINCYIDRDIDGLMSRTKNRPIPRDQLDPHRALGFGLAASVASFAVLLAFVNLLAAVLAVFGIIYYVFVYTLWLKRTTPHNIVIGGIAGAVPPLVGWAAVTGRLDLLALYLFLIVFYWTPPHTWALAILVRGDYEKAGVPMLPVVAGEAETRRQIWLYSLQLVAVTLLVFAFRLLGWVYLALAVVLNGLFLWLAFRLKRDRDKPAAKRLYKYSQLYLALLFAAMVVDASLV